MTTTTDTTPLAALPPLPPRRLRGRAVPPVLPDDLAGLLLAEHDAYTAAAKARAHYADLTGNRDAARQAAHADTAATEARRGKGDFGPAVTTATDAWQDTVRAAHREAVYRIEQATLAADQVTRHLMSKTGSAALQQHLTEQRAKHAERVAAALAKVQDDLAAITLLDATLPVVDRRAVAHSGRVALLPDAAQPTGPVLDAARALLGLLTP